MIDLSKEERMGLDTRDLHLVVMSEAMLLVKRPDRTWEDLQEEFFDFKTSLGPFDVEELLALLHDEWPSTVARYEEIRSFVTSPANVLSL